MTANIKWFTGLEGAGSAFSRKSTSISDASFITERRLTAENYTLLSMGRVLEEDGISQSMIFNTWH